MTLPGSKGEHDLQKLYDTTERARAFYEKQMLDHLNPAMQKFISRQEIVFIGTADSAGECDCSIRAGLPGFVRVLDEKSLVYPEYRGNGVTASLGNISENPHIAMIFVDFFASTVGLHINGKAAIIENEQLVKRTDLPNDIGKEIRIGGGMRPERWVLVEVEEAYIHCSKHIPKLKKAGKEIHWGTDDEIQKGGDFFGAGECAQ
ncbi:pyridoxamine 5'-phosphate oxidase family protein [Candidatus Sumerlaeota bacterium]|nr:pyridoxamine 5'-phosphate oxidase family protein [Candidatus Sumerlaeota bacterium]